MTRVACRLVASVAAWLAIAGPAPASPPSPTDMKQLREAAAMRPSVHADWPAIESALETQGVPRDTLARLQRAVDSAVLPGLGSRLDGFLFQTRDAEWLALRDRFAEFLTLRGVDRLTKPLIAPLEDYDGVISFPDITSLDAGQARWLRRFGDDDWGTAVEFPSVRRLDARTAAALARCLALVVLPNLEDLSTDTAAALARHEGTGLVIGGIARLDTATAKALSDCRSMQGLLLPDLQELDSLPLARRLAAQSSVFLPRVTELKPEVAAALRDNQGGALSLPGLRVMTTDLARQLVGAGYFSLTLGGLADLTADAAAALAAHQGPLVFTGTLGPAPEIASELDAHRGDLVFQHVARLSSEVASRLRSGDHLLVLPAIAELQAPEAAGLAAAGPLSLPGLHSLDVATARALATHDALLQLDGLRDLPAPVAAALATHRGPLHLTGLATLSAEAALVLAAFPDGLVLDGITALDRGAATALLARRHPLSVTGLQAVERFESAEVARLAAHWIDDPAFPFLTAIEGPEAAAIASALADSKGTLMLPSLTRITPRALASLMQKADVELPSVESLELVLDPAGGADDFVDPRR